MDSNDGRLRRYNAERIESLGNSKKKKKDEQKVTFQLIPHKSIHEQGKERIPQAVADFKQESALDDWLESVTQDFRDLGSILQNQVLSTMEAGDRKAKLTFVDLILSCTDDNFYSFCKPARLVSYLLGTPDELYDEKHFVKKVIKPLGQERRDWKKLSTADLFQLRSERIGSLHYLSPWGVECYTVFDIDPANGEDVQIERERKQHVFMTNTLARKILYKYNREFRAVYQGVDKQLKKCMPVLAKYGADTQYTDFEGLDFGVFQ